MDTKINQFDEKLLSQLENTFKEQMSETKPTETDQSSKKIKSISAAFVILFVIISVGFYAIFPLFNSNNLSENNLKENVVSSSTAVLKPDPSINNKRSFNGKIMVEKVGGQDKFVLNDDTGKLIGYLQSDKLDLSIMLGIRLTVVGQYTKETVNGEKVIMVEAIEFQ